MADLHEEDVLGKAYDSRLMRRLLSYAKPYWYLFALSIVLVLFVTGTELIRPYLIKVAIDDYITAYDRPLVAFSPTVAPQSGVEFQGRVFVRERDLPDAQIQTGQPYQIVEDNGRYFLTLGHHPDTRQLEARQREGGWVVFDPGAGGAEYEAQLLDEAALRQFRASDARSVTRLGLIFIIIVTAGFILNYAQTNLLAYTGQKIIYNIRKELFAHLEGLSISFFDKNPVGRLVTRVTNDTETLNEMYTDVLVNLFKDVFTVIGVVIIMLQLNWRVALIVLTVMPLVIASSIVFRAKVRVAYRQVRVKLARINATLAENFSGMKVIQIFAQEKKKTRQFNAINKDYLDASMAELTIFAVFRPLMEFLSSIGLALLVWFGGNQVLDGTLQFGVLYAFINYVGHLFNPINQLTDKYNVLQAAMASSERIFQLLDNKSTIADPPTPQPITRVQGKVEFRNVWFAYVDDEWVLKDVNFSVEPGETVAFVGATGAGKTSIISLLNRFYDIQKGQILVDGVDIRQMRKEDLRRQIAVVLQDVFLFTGDIKANIRLNNTDITDEKLTEVAKYVNAHRFIERLPAGYDEPVAERGSTLSMGQRQLLAFARALAFDPAILVLDEATANIDTETELLIQDALEKLTKGRTTFVIAHRLSTIQRADKIVVLHKGVIREIGSHQELLRNRGLYYKLYQLQYKEQLGTQPSAEGNSALA